MGVESPFVVKLRGSSGGAARGIGDTRINLEQSVDFGHAHQRLHLLGGTDEDELAPVPLVGDEELH
jgi:hypothetical protein